MGPARMGEVERGWKGTCGGCMETGQGLEGSGSSKTSGSRRESKLRQSLGSSGLQRMNETLCCIGRDAAWWRARLGMGKLPAEICRSSSSS